MPNYIPTSTAAVSVEREPPKRGDPIPASLDGALKNCIYCRVRIIPRHAAVAAVEAPPPPLRGEPIPSLAAYAI